jgi:nucleoside-diphosphate-sugar epimerase
MRILVTGGTGFIASHCIAQLLSAGYVVRTTVRDLRRADDVRSTLRRGGSSSGEQLSFVAADLQHDVGWAEAVADCQYVLHVASPFPVNVPSHEDELIIPARDGALRVLRAARDAGVNRVVLTSSFAAIGYGHAPRVTPFDETSWTSLAGAPLAPYVKSKTLAERAAWDFMAREAGHMQLAVINPVMVFGPAWCLDLSTSILLVQRLLNGSIPACPRLSIGIVDVCDVADLHVRAMTHPSASGERFLAVAGPNLSILEIAQLLRSHLGASARRVPRRQLPDWLVRVAAAWDPSIRQILPELGTVKQASHDKATRMLGWMPRPAQTALLSTAQSLVELGGLL